MFSGDLKEKDFEVKFVNLIWFLEEYVVLVFFSWWFGFVYMMSFFFEFWLFLLRFDYLEW